MSTEQIIAVWKGDEQAAEEVLHRYTNIPDDAPISIRSASAISKDADGKTHVKHLGDEKHSARWGAAAGAAIGLLAGPGGAVIGGVLGAGVGEMSKHISEHGVPKDLENEYKEGLPASSSALITFAQTNMVERLVNTLKESGAEVFSESVSGEVSRGGQHPTNF